MLSAPTATTPRSAAHSVPHFATPAASRYAGSSPHKVANPVRTSNVSPARTSTPCAAAHAVRSSAVIPYSGGSRGTPFHPATSSSTPRVSSGGTVSTPSAVNPAGVCVPATGTSPYIVRSHAWWQRASMWVPLCSIIVRVPDAPDRGPSSAGRCVSSWRRWRA